MAFRLLTLIQIMLWRRQALSCYLNQWWVVFNWTIGRKKFNINNTYISIAKSDLRRSTTKWRLFCLIFIVLSYMLFARFSYFRHYFVNWNFIIRLIHSVWMNHISLKLCRHHEYVQCFPFRLHFTGVIILELLRIRCQLSCTCKCMFFTQNWELIWSRHCRRWWHLQY